MSRHFNQTDVCTASKGYSTGGNTQTVVPFPETSEVCSLHLHLSTTFLKVI